MNSNQLAISGLIKAAANDYGVPHIGSGPDEFRAFQLGAKSTLEGLDSQVPMGRMGALGALLGGGVGALGGAGSALFGKAESGKERAKTALRRALVGGLVGSGAGGLAGLMGGAGVRVGQRNAFHPALALGALAGQGDLKQLEEYGGPDYDMSNSPGYSYSSL